MWSCTSKYDQANWVAVAGVYGSVCFPVSAFVAKSAHSV